jgi:hypothetical protein
VLAHTPGIRRRSALPSRRKLALGPIAPLETGMHIVRIEHATSDYEKWKALFDSDPIDRAGSGVGRHRVMRSVEDPNVVVVDLEFDDPDSATAILQKLRELWGRTDVVRDARGTLVEVVETNEY